jgi:hypothetical protein
MFSSPEKRGFVGLWNELVGRYSALALTYLSDKLPSIFGVAQIFKQKHESNYLAGLWIEHLLVALLWCVSSGERALLWGGTKLVMSLNKWENGYAYERRNPSEKLARILETYCEYRSSDMTG